MSSRPLFRPQVVASAVSMTTTAHSLPSNINMISAVGYTLSYGSGSSGAFSVEVSNDYVPTPPGVVPSDPNTGTWVAVPMSVNGGTPTLTPVVTTGTGGSAYLDVVGISAAWIRLTFTNTSGSGGTWTATVAGKVQ